MSRVEKAAELHKCKYNCAQCVFAALGDLTGVDEKASLSIAGGFGSGARNGDLCGAVSGALMALGVIYPFYENGDMDSKKRIEKAAKEFTDKFRSEYGSIVCRELKDPEKGRVSCHELIKGAVKIAEEMIENKE